MEGFYEGQFGKTYESDSFEWNMWDPNFYLETRLYGNPIKNSDFYIKFYPDKDYEQSNQSLSVLSEAHIGFRQDNNESGFSANLLIGPLDAILAGISTEAAALIQTDYQVNAAGNYYFMIVSTVLVALVGTWVTEKIICVRLPGGNETIDPMEKISETDTLGLKAVAFFSLLFICLLLVGLVPDSGILRDQVSGSILRSPFISGIVTTRTPTFPASTNGVKLSVSLFSHVNAIHAIPQTIQIIPNNCCKNFC